jgi:ribosomal protein S18 acetylase RimI-like enzyme
MVPNNFERMIRMSDEVFATKTDPDQLDINDEILDQLKALHPATVSERRDENGPIVWILVIPTTQALMQAFLSAEISERELFNKTRPGQPFDALYLCSAMVLEEYRKQGYAKEVCMEAIEAIKKDHTIKFLFAWTFSKEGLQTARSVATALKIPFLNREK